MTTVMETVTIGNEQGLHARPAAQLVHIAGNFKSSLKLRRPGSPMEADCSSVLSLLMLAASKGSRVEVTASGEDAPEALQAVVEYFNANFNEN